MGKHWSRLLLIVILITSLSCDETDNPPPVPEDPLNGDWFLVNYNAGGFGGITNTDFEIGDNTWTIDTEANTITINSPDIDNCTLGICNSTIDYVIIVNDDNISEIHRTWYDDQGNSLGMMYFFEITSLSDTELILTNTNFIDHIRWTFTK